jgi:hypothetical protein
LVSYLKEKTKIEDVRKLGPEEIHGPKREEVTGR